MASVFLSYDREDADRGSRIAHALEKAGHSVWWDRRIKSGAQYGREIDQALKRSHAVVVLWSEKSIDSAWVRDEAAAGRDSNKLVPARIDPVDPPLGFRQYQTTDLTRWKGRRTPEGDEMLEAIAALPQASLAPDAPPAPQGRPVKRRTLTRPLALGGALVAIATIGLLAWMLMGQSSPVPVVAVAAADSSPASQALARDLLVKLGTLKSSQAYSIDLVGEGGASNRTDLTFQVGRTGQGAEANLALTDQRNRSLLWAQDFRDPSGNEADLRQQLAYAAAHVLGCAVETVKPSAGRLSRQGLKTYLQACAPASDLYPDEMANLLPQLRQLVHQSPRFAGGWAKLLSTETAVATEPHRADAEAIRRLLPRDVVEARKLHPDLPETYIAQMTLTPEWQFLTRGRILDLAVQRNPDNAELRGVRRSFLFNVGRVEDSLQDARYAIELDPLSPSMREGYVMSLAFAGRMDEALAELDEAERLWPGAASVRNARYLLQLRAGDPREALRLLRAGVLQRDSTSWVRIQETFLQARIDRSPAKVEAAVQTARHMYGQIPQSITALAQTLVEFDREEELFQILLNWRRPDIVTHVTDVLFRPAFADFHKNPRFMQVAKRLGLLDYWRATGKWPDFCSRADLPYDCEREAAEIAA